MAVPEGLVVLPDDHDIDPAGLLGGLAGGVRQLAVAHQQTALAVGEQGGQLLRAEVPVQRHEHGSGPRAGDRPLRPLGPVTRQHRPRRPGEAAVVEATGEPPAPCLDLVPAEGPVTVCDRRGARIGDVQQAPWLVFAAHGPHLLVRCAHVSCSRTS